MTVIIQERIDLILKSKLCTGNESTLPAPLTVLLRIEIRNPPISNTSLLISHNSNYCGRFGSFFSFPYTFPDFGSCVESQFRWDFWFSLNPVFLSVLPLLEVVSEDLEDQLLFQVGVLEALSAE